MKNRRIVGKIIPKLDKISMHVDLGNLTEESECERSAPHISAKISWSVKALGGVELDC